MTNEERDAVYAAIRAGKPWTLRRPESRAYDPDLYHRALTGRGAPIDREDVLTLLEQLEDQTDDWRKLEEERDVAKRELEEAWIVPKDEPYRPCGLCRPVHDRGDGRCERHGRYVVTVDKLLALMAAGPLPDDEIVLRKLPALLTRELARARDAVAKLNRETVDRIVTERRRIARSSSYGKTSGGGARFDQLLHAVPAGVRRDEEDRLLSERSGDAPRDLLGALEDGATARVDGRGEDLDHQTVLARSLPDAARPEVGGALEDLSDELLHLRDERAAVERGGQLLVAAGGAGDPRADVEADGAARLEVAPGGRRAVAEDAGEPTSGGGASASHAPSVPQDATVLKDRLPRRNRLWIYASVDRNAKTATLETSWLPKVGEVSDPLTPLGFRRAADGCYRAELSLSDRLGIVRAATRAFDVMLTEEVSR